MKACATCGVMLPDDSYYRHGAAKCGRFASCKRCVCARQLAARKLLEASPRYRVHRGAYVLGVWSLNVGRCMRCHDAAAVAVLVKELGELPLALRLCAADYATMEIAARSKT